MKKSNKVHGFFQSLAQPLLKYNDPEAISKKFNNSTNVKIKKNS